MFTNAAWAGPMIATPDLPQTSALKFSTDYAQPRKVVASEDRVSGRIHKAALLGDISLFRHTIEADRSKVNKLLSGRLHGMTPLHYACLFGHFDLVKEMVELGADPMITASADVPPECHSGNWPLSSGNTSRGYIVDLNDEELTTIHMACCAVPRPDRTESGGIHIEDQSARAKLVTYLSFIGVDPSAQTKVNDMTALHYASIFGLNECCKVLMELGVEIGKVNCSGDTPLSLAVKEGNALTVRTLVRRGNHHSFETHSLGGLNLLHLAIDKGHTSVVKVLLELGADVNAATTQDEETPLLLATRKGDLEMVKLILEHKPDVTHRNVSGMTALHVAYSLGQFDIASTLLKQASSRKVHSLAKDLAWQADSSSECIISPERA